MLPGFDTIPEKEPEEYPDRIVEMWKVYGRFDGRKCGECCHLKTKQYGNTYYKCRLTNETNGASTDWRKSWPACGKFEITP